MTRAISTVLDASLCLLLVSASALTLVDISTENGSNPRTSDETAELLATTTAQVSYEVRDENRSAHDTLAGLLATAAAASGRGGDSQTVSAARFERAVTERVNRTLRRTPNTAQVVARRASPRPATHGERVIAGRRPPPKTDVHAAVFSVSNVRITVRTWSE